MKIWRISDVHLIKDGEDHVHTDLRASYLGGRLNVQDDFSVG